MARITVDTDLLLKKAEEIHALDESLRNNADNLLAAILSVVGRYPDLIADAQKDALAAREVIQTLRSRLSQEAEALLALAKAYQSIDDEAIETLLRMRGEEGFLRTFFPIPIRPEIEGFEPYYVPQTRMVRTDWAPVYALGPRQLTQTDTYHTGRIAGNVIGTWVNPKTKKKYCVLDMGGGKFAFVPDGKLSPPIDLSKIPNREDVFTEGQRGPISTLWNPQAADGRQGEWRAAGDPWQNLIIGNMRVTGLRGATFPATPHANLCGELSVFFAVGETDLEAGLSRFAQLKGLGFWNIPGKKTEYNGTQVLQNVTHATSAYDLKRLFEEYRWKSKIQSGVVPMPDELAEKLRSGKKMISLTELDTRTKIHSKESGEWIDNPAYGQLVPGAQAHAAGRAAHWVTVTDVFQDKRGTIHVKVLNTYSGCEETYTWDTFHKTCRNPGSSMGSYTYVEAVKPSE